MNSHVMQINWGDWSGFFITGLVIVTAARFIVGLIKNA